MHMPEYSQGKIAAANHAAVPSRVIMRSHVM